MASRISAARAGTQRLDSETGRRTPIRILTITTFSTGMQQRLLSASLHYTPRAPIWFKRPTAGDALSIPYGG